jgi:hypothetical protein
MGLSSYILAYRDMDGEFAKMAEVKAFCDEKGVTLPKEVEEYFGKYSLDPIEYCKEQMSEVILPNGVFKKSQDDSREFFDVDISKLPKEVKIIRFVNSY